MFEFECKSDDGFATHVQITYNSDANSSYYAFYLCEDVIDTLKEILRNPESDCNYGNIYYDKGILSIEFEINQGNNMFNEGTLMIRKKEDIFRLVNLILEAFK